MANPKRSTWSLKKFPIAVLERGPKKQKKQKKISFKLGNFY
jgi:hypothetical protein